MNDFNYYDNNYSQENGYQQETYSAYNYTQPVQPKKKSSASGKIIAVALACSIIGGAAGAGGTVLGLRYLNRGEQTVASTTEKGGSTTLLTANRTSDTKVSQTSVDTGTQMTAAEVYEQNVNSTVGITTSITTNYFGYETTAAASGSGFIISADGYILTNYHVIEDASSITVTAYDGTTYDAELIGSDSSNDIAVLKIDADGLTPVVLGSSDDLNVGEQVVAIGNPLGELTFSLTEGVVSALDREVTTEQATMNLIQTDCAINSGNSGGALFNMYGEVVGITNAKYSSSSYNEASIDNIGFAIPIDTVRDIVTGLIENGYVTKPYIGVSVADVSDDAAGYGLPSGAAIKAVTENGPADKAGLKVNDIVTEVDGEEITSSSDLIAAIKKTSKGDEVTLKVYRQGTYINITVTIDEKKQDDTDEQQSTQQQSTSPYSYGYGYDDYSDFPFGGMFGY